MSDLGVLSYYLRIEVKQGYPYVSWHTPASF
jgi:hypothetical protein